LANVQNKKFQPPKSPEGGLLDSENAKLLQSIEVWLLSFGEAGVRFCLLESKEAAMMDFSGDLPFPAGRRSVHRYTIIELLLCNRLCTRLTIYKNDYLFCSQIIKNEYWL
jgi:hypothetical protein